MIKFDKPQNLNGLELRQELTTAGIQISNDPFAVIVENNELYLDISAKDAKLAETIVATHNGTTISTELTIADKLQSVGLNLDDLKTALGL